MTQPAPASPVTELPEPQNASQDGGDSAAPRESRSASFSPKPTYNPPVTIKRGF